MVLFAFGHSMTEGTAEAEAQVDVELAPGAEGLQGAEEGDELAIGFELDMPESGGAMELDIMLLLGEAIIEELGDAIIELLGDAIIESLWDTITELLGETMIELLGIFEAIIELLGDAITELAIIELLGGANMELLGEAVIELLGELGAAGVLLLITGGLLEFSGELEEGEDLSKETVVVVLGDDIRFAEDEGAFVDVNMELRGVEPAADEVMLLDIPVFIGLVDHEADAATDIAELLVIEDAGIDAIMLELSGGVEPTMEEVGLGGAELAAE